MTFGAHNVCDTRDVKVFIIGLLKRGIKTFDERTSKSDLKAFDEELYERERFSALLEEFVDILDESWEEK